MKHEGSLSEALGIHLKAKLNEVGISYREASAHLNISPATLHRKLKHGQFLQASEIDKICELVGVLPSEAWEAVEEASREAVKGDLW